MFIAFQNKNLLNKKLIFTSLTEGFFTYTKLAIWSGFILSFPIFAWQLYFFISPGLYKKEKWMVLPYIVFAPILFLSGAAFVYCIVMPYTWEFFLSYEIHTSIVPIALEAKISEYLDLVIEMVIGFGLAFQMPLIISILNSAGVIFADGLKAYRKYAIVGIFVIAAVLTPPDVISQVILAVPLMLLYEVSILICGYLEKKRI